MTLSQLAIILLVALPLAVLMVAVTSRARARVVEGRRYRRRVQERLDSIEPLVLSPEEREAATYWTFHNRECRRRLIEAGIGPTSVRHLHGCLCNGPARAWEAASALMRARP